MSLFRLAALLCIPAVLGGCASTSVFSPYPGQAAQYRAALDAGSPDAAIAHIGGKTRSADATLYLMEKGRVAQLAQQPDTSRAAFDEAIARLQAQDDRATVSASRYAASGASLLTNDNARPYDGRTYERVFVHQYQALNYLAAGDRTAAAAASEGPAWACSKSVHWVLIRLSRWLRLSGSIVPRCYPKRAGAASGAL